MGMIMDSVVLDLTPLKAWMIERGIVRLAQEGAAHDPGAHAAKLGVEVFDGDEICAAFSAFDPGAVCVLRGSCYLAGMAVGAIELDF